MQREYSQYTGDIYTVDVGDNLRDCGAMVAHTIQVQFGKRVRALRESRGYSQEAFAALANFDRSAFGKLERGEINAGLTSLARIAVALEIGLPELLHSVEIDPETIKAIPRSARGPKPIGARD